MEGAPPVYLRCVGGTHDGSTLPVYPPLVTDGTHCAFPSLPAFEAIRDAPKDEPVSIEPDDTWERYVVHGEDDGFVLRFAGTLAKMPPPWNPLDEA